LKTGKVLKSIGLDPEDVTTAVHAQGQGGVSPLLAYEIIRVRYTEYFQQWMGFAIVATSKGPLLASEAKTIVNSKSHELRGNCPYVVVTDSFPQLNPNWYITHVFYLIRNKGIESRYLPMIRRAQMGKDEYSISRVCGVAAKQRSIFPLIVCVAQR
jgi:hypothetical protein